MSTGTRRVIKHPLTKTVNAMLPLSKLPGKNLAVRVQGGYVSGMRLDSGFARFPPFLTLPITILVSIIFEYPLGHPLELFFAISFCTGSFWSSLLLFVSSKAINLHTHTK